MYFKHGEVMRRFFNIVLASILHIVYFFVVLLIFAWIMSGAPLIAYFLMIFVIASFIAMRDSYCSICRCFFRRKCISRTLVEPTYHSQGKERVTIYCSHCSYRRVSKKIIPMLSDQDEDDIIPP
jgi:hypothetical protein